MDSTTSLVIAQYTLVICFIYSNETRKILKESGLIHRVADILGVENLLQPLLDDSDNIRTDTIEHMARKLKIKIDDRVLQGKLCNCHGIIDLLKSNTRRGRIYAYLFMYHVNLTAAPNILQQRRCQKPRCAPHL